MTTPQEEQQQVPDEPGFIWRVTYTKDAPVGVEFGDELSPYTDATKARVVGEMLVRLGTRLVQTQEEDFDDADEDWGDDDE